MYAATMRCFSGVQCFLAAVSIPLVGWISRAVHENLEKKLNFSDLLLCCPLSSVGKVQVISDNSQQ